MARWLVSFTPLLAVSALSCSDPAAVPAQGAVYISVSPPPGGDTCNVGSVYSLPSGRALTAIRDYGGEDPETGEIYRVVDGDDSTNVECTVAVESEASININLSMNKPRSLAFGVRGTINANGGTVRVAEWDNQTGVNLAGDCTVTARVVKEGAIFASFDCLDFNNGELINCASSGAFVFENCDKK